MTVARETRLPVALMAGATGLGVASQYYNQPLLGLIGQDFGVSGAQATWVATITQLGYACGLVGLIPLGDRHDRRTLIAGQCVMLAVAMAMAAMAPDFAVLLSASFLIGVSATIGQHILPMAAQFAAPAQRVRIIAAITHGLLAGALLSRPVASAIDAGFSWRAVFACGALIAGVLARVLSVHLPCASLEPAKNRATGHADMQAIDWRIVLQNRTLMVLTGTQSLLFFGFSVFWTSLPFALEAEPFRVSGTIAGGFGFLALGGLVVSEMVGHGGTDAKILRRGRAGAVMMVCGFCVMAMFETYAALAVGVIVMMAGLQVALIAHQGLVLSQAGIARGRFNTVFMATQFGFGALGSWLVGMSWARIGWQGAMIVALAAALTALAIQARMRASSLKTELSL